MSSSLTHHTTDTAALAAAVARGDRNALGKLYDRFAPALMGIILRHSRDQHHAEAILQQTFLGFWQMMQGKSSTTLPPFQQLVQIARQLSAEMKSTANREATEFVSIDDPSASVLALVLLQGFSLAEAARALGLPEEETRKKIRSEFNALRKTPHE